MTQIPSDHPTTEDQELLVAYLDGELDAATAERVERRLAEDEDFRRQLRSMQEAWDLLDHLPQTTLDEKFTRTTVEMVAVQLSNEIQQNAPNWKQRVRKLAPLAAIVLCGLVGYGVTRGWQARLEQQFVQDLPLIDRLDHYRHLSSSESLDENVQFLQALAATDLFNTEPEQEPTRDKP